jgi:succinate dehydrogenase hydrophobic anchor subunit
MGVDRATLWLPLRPTLMFVSGFAINTSVHEAAHAFAAGALGIPARLFHFYASVDLAAVSTVDQAVVRGAGPVASLVLGAICWWAARVVRGTGLVLPLFYLGVFGIAMFLGNLMSTAFVGDFSNAAVTAGLSSATRLVIAAAGGVATIGFGVGVGHWLRARFPPCRSALEEVAAIVVLPAILGTVAIVLMYQPLPENDTFARVSEESFWVFVAIGALLPQTRAAAESDLFRTRRGDWILVVVAMALVRVLALGITLR